MYKVVLEYADGRDAVIEHRVRYLADAVVFALDVADRAGHYQGDGHGPPRLVHVLRGERYELTINVQPGGLAAGGC